MRRTGKIIGWGFAVFVALLMFGIFGIGDIIERLNPPSEAKVAAKKAKKKEENAEDSRKSFKEFHGKQVILLALKYKIDEKNLFNLLHESHGLLLMDGGWVNNADKSPRKVIAEYSQKYDIVETIIASVFMDFEAMNQSATFNLDDSTMAAEERESPGYAP